MIQHTKKYWACIIGSTEDENIPYGADYPMRMATKNTYGCLMGENAENCWSGWGLTEERKELVMKVWNMQPGNMPTKNEIEASKDMYEALEDIVAAFSEAIEQEYSHDPDKVTEIAKAKKALQKAKGENQ